MTWLLAQNSFEAYQALTEHPHLMHRLDNPFRPELLGEPGYYFIPWAGDVGLYFSWALTLGILLLWVYRRVNSTPAFELAGAVLVGLALTLILYFRSAFPHPFGLLLLGTLALALLISVTPVLAVAAVQKLPYFGVEEKTLTDPRDGSVRPMVLFGSAAFLVGVAWVALPLHFKVLKAILQFWPVFGAGATSRALVLFMAVLLAGIVGYELLPWREVPGQTVLGGGPMKELPPIFRMDGPAPRGEVVIVGLGACLSFVGTLFLFKSAGRITGADVGGLFFMSLLAFVIIKAELGRAARDEQLPQHKRPKGPWG